MTLAPDLADHLLSQPIQLPSRWALNRARLEYDFATMIFAQKFLLSPEKQWFVHVRADASPKGGRDFLVSELDYCQLPSNGPEHISKLLEHGCIQMRLLPLTTIGAKAASTIHKGFELLKAMSMESGDLSVTISRTMTMLFDFGAESGIWKLSESLLRPRLFPDEDEDKDTREADAAEAVPRRLFHRTLPLADADHALHHDAW